MKLSILGGMFKVALLFILYCCNPSEKKDSDSAHFVAGDAAKFSFETPLYDGKYTPSRFVSKFMRTSNYNLSYIDSNHFRITLRDTLNESPIFWRFEFSDHYLSYYGISFQSCELSKNCFDKFYKMADSIISAFTARFGIPTHKVKNENNFYKDGQVPEYPGVILDVTWGMEDQQINLNFNVTGEHNMYEYSLRLNRSRQFLSNSTSK